MGAFACPCMCLSVCNSAETTSRKVAFGLSRRNAIAVLYLQNLDACQVSGKKEGTIRVHVTTHWPPHTVPYVSFFFFIVYIFFIRNLLQKEIVCERIRIILEKQNKTKTIKKTNKILLPFLFQTYLKVGMFFLCFTNLIHFNKKLDIKRVLIH